MSKQIEQIVRASWIDATKVLNNLKRSGRLFRVDFEKRSTSETRSMVCRFGVKSELTGGRRSYNPDNKDLLVVYEPFIGYRSIPMDGISFIKSDGVLYDFRNLNVGVRRKPSPNLNRRKKLPVVGW